MRALRSIVVAAAVFVSASAAGQGVTLPGANRVVLDNGVVLIVNEKRDVPMIGVSAKIRGGAVEDPAGKHGLASLFATLIEKGAGDRSGAEFAEAIDAVGGRLSASAGLESITISGDFLSRNADLMIELLADMLLRPALDEDEFDKLRDRSINMLLAAKDADPGELMPTYAHAYLFGEHPYGNPVDGSEATLATIRHDDVRRYYEEQVGGDRLIVAVSGDFDAAEMQTKLVDAFGEWRPATSAAVGVTASESAPGGRVLLIDKPGATQTYFWIGNVGVAVDFAQRADLDIANTLFGGRFTSMLNNALRVESGLTYGARSSLLRPAQPGSVGISSFTATESTVEAIDMALGVLATLQESGIDDDMLSSVQNYLLGQFPPKLETATQLAAQFATLESYGLDNDYVDGYGAAISAVSTASVADVVAAVYPWPDELVFVLLGDAEAIRELVAKYGSVTEVSITEPSFHVSPTDSADE